MTWNIDKGHAVLTGDRTKAISFDPNFAPDQTEDGVANPDGDKDPGMDTELASFINRQKAQHSEMAQMFTRALKEEPTFGDMLKETAKARVQIDQLQREISKVRQSLLFGNLLSLALVACAVALLVMVYRSPISRWDAQGNASQESAEVATAQGNTTLPASVSSAMASPAASSGLGSSIPEDNPYRTILHDLYSRARQMRSGTDPNDAIAREEYVRFLTDLSRTSERAAEENVSTNIRLTIVNIATVAQQLRESRGEVNLDTKQLMEEIEAQIYALR